MARTACMEATILNPGIVAESLRPTRNSELARSILALEPAEIGELTVDQVEVPGNRALYLSELLIGNYASDLGFFDEVVEEAKKDPPDVVVISGLVQGDFKYKDKPRRPTLLPKYRTMDAQFGEARVKLDKVKELGKPIIYNISNDDRQLAEDYTVEVMRMLLKEQDRDDLVQRDLPYWRVEQMRQHPAWNEHLDFQIHQVFPFMLAHGRRLKRASENNGIEEYFEMFEAYRNDPEDFNERWGKRDIVVTDDLDLTMGIHQVGVRHNMNFSNAPMYQSFIHNQINVLAQLAANNEPTPDMLVTQHNQELVAIDTGDGWAVSNPGFIDSKKQTQAKGSITGAVGDVAKRSNSTRGRMSAPGAVEHELTNDGRHRIRIYDGELMEKMDSTDRFTIAEICDVQTGSITMNPDVLLRYLDIIRERLGAGAVALALGGDIIHGSIYPDFKNESQSTGLMAGDSQVQFNEELLGGALKGLTPQEARHIIRIIIQKGNHEWGNGTQKQHGYSFVDYLRTTFEKALIRAGYTDDQIEQTITQQEGFMTQRGEVVVAPTSIDYFGDYGVLLQHYLLERGANKGAGTVPVSQADNYIKGGKSNFRHIDVFMAGHHHHPQVARYRHKLAIIGGSGGAGESGFEAWRGYRAQMGGTLIHLAGGEVPEVEFLSEKYLKKHMITTGEFQNERIEELGYVDDKGHDPLQHGIMMPRGIPKSGLQQYLRDRMQDVSERRGRLGKLK